MKNRKTYIGLKSSKLLYGIEWRKVVSDRKFLKIEIAIATLLVSGCLLYKWNNTQQDTIENKGFQEKYQEAPKFAKDSLINLLDFKQENQKAPEITNSLINIAPPTSLENEEIK